MAKDRCEGKPGLSRYRRRGLRRNGRKDATGGVAVGQLASCRSANCGVGSLLAIDRDWGSIKCLGAPTMGGATQLCPRLRSLRSVAVMHQSRGCWRAGDHSPIGRLERTSVCGGPYRMRPERRERLDGTLSSALGLLTPDRCGTVPLVGYVCHRRHS